MEFKRIKSLSVAFALLATSQAHARFSAFQNFRQDCAPNCSRQNLFDQGETASGTAADRERDQARDLDRQAERNRDFADQIEKDRNALNNQLANVSPTEREKILSNAYKPKEERFQQLAKDTGLTTNASLLRRSETVVETARDYAQRQTAQAQKMFQSADRASAASAELKNFSHTFENRIVSMNSLDSKRANSQAGRGAPEVSASRTEGNGGADAADRKGPGSLEQGPSRDSNSANAPAGKSKLSAETDLVEPFNSKLSALESRSRGSNDGKASPGAYKDLLAKDLGLDDPKKKQPDSLVMQLSSDLDAHMDQVMQSRGGGRRLASVESQGSQSSALRAGPDISLFKRVHNRLEIHQERGNLVLQDN